MKETTNYKLKKYEDADYADPSQAMNPNMDAIDAALKALEDGKASLGEDGTIPAEQLPDLDYEPPLKDNAAKATPADGDSLPLVDSADGGKTKRVLWSRIKAVLKTYFDPIYAAAAHSHAWSTITGKPSSFAPSAHASTHGSSGSDPITPAAIGAAAATHTHAAGDITSGTLSTARGGTGNANGTVAKLTTARTIRTNLGSTSTASFDGSANVTPGVTGTLPIANGGTGQTTAAKALYALINGSFGLDYSEAAAGDFLALLDASAETGKKISLNNLINYMQLLGGVPKIATGSYTGTGTYGASNPCSLTFPFLPKLVIIRETGANYSNSKWSGYFTAILIPDAGGPTIGIEDSVIIYGVNNALSQTFTDTGISWHSTRSALYQLNTANRDYGYIAIG